MKLRIKGNSIRFRLTQSEVKIVEQTGLVKDQIKFSNSISPRDEDESDMFPHPKQQ